MSFEEPWSNSPKIDPLVISDILMRRTPSRTVKNQEIPFSDVTAFLAGSAMVFVASEADLPPVGPDGFITLDYDKNYMFTEPGFYTTPILFPANWTGSIRKTFVTADIIAYIGTGKMFQTLNLEGVIDSITDAGSGAITLVISAPHGMLNGQFLNITGTTSYNQTRLAVSNVTANTLDVQIAFVADESGDFNTGYRSIQFIDFGIGGAGTADFMDLTSSGDPTSSILFTRFAAVGFLSPGILRKTTNLVARDSIFGIITTGLELQDTTTAIIETTNFISLSPIPGVIALNISGAATKRVGVTNSSFNMTDVTQLPVRIDPAIVAALEITFTNSPDNDITTDYFDQTGLTETNPQVNADNNGVRKNSQTIGSAFINGNAVQTTIAAANTFQDINFGALIPSASIERFVLSNVVNAEFTYIGLKPLNSPLSMSLTIRKVGGATAIYDVKFVIDKGAGFVDFTDNIILPFEVKTANSSATYECQAQLENGDKIKPQISGIGTSDDIVADSVSINF